LIWIKRHGSGAHQRQSILHDHVYRHSACEHGVFVIELISPRRRAQV